MLCCDENSQVQALDRTQTDGATRVWAVVTPNQKPAPGWAMNDFAVSIADIEEATGFDLVPSLPAPEQPAVEEAVHAVKCW